MADEGFLEHVNNMLTAGIPPTLYPEEEKEPLIGSVRDEVQKQARNCFRSLDPPLAPPITPTANGPRLRM